MLVSLSPSQKHFFIEFPLPPLLTCKPLFPEDICSCLPRAPRGRARIPAVLLPVPLTLLNAVFSFYFFSVWGSLLRYPPLPYLVVFFSYTLPQLRSRAMDPRANSWLPPLTFKAYPKLFLTFCHWVG